MLLANDVLELIACLVMIPAVLTGTPALRAIGLDALFENVGELSSNLHRQVLAGILPREAVIEPVEELTELGFELAKL